MKKLFFIASISLLLTACGKDNDTPPKTKTELITQASWKFSGATVSGTDVSPFLQTCQKDNILKLNTNGTGTLDEGATKCNGADPQTSAVTWSFQSGETQLFVSSVLYTGGSNTYTLVSLTETQLVASQTITVNGSAQNAVVTFVH